MWTFGLWWLTFSLVIGGAFFLTYWTSQHHYARRLRDTIAAIKAKIIVRSEEI